LAACGALTGTWDTAGPAIESTFRKILARAQSGDAESQNAVGYMLYHGEGVAMDRAQANLWFRRAAAQGNARAQRNLESVSAGNRPAPSGSPARPEREPLRADASRGERLYMMFCAGCHGANGISAYENSPSFAFGEGFEKSDAVLMRKLREGSQEMPGWDGKFSRDELLAVMAFVRTLRAPYDAGVGQALRAAPGYYFLFGPMEARRLGATAAPK
jgi:TPR repeat protein